MTFFNELKRIFSPVLLIIIVILSVIFYFAFETQIINYRDKNGFGAEYNVAIHLAEKFGPQIDDNEMQGVMEYRQELVDILDNRVESALSKYDVHTFEQLKSIYHSDDEADIQFAEKMGNAANDIIFCSESFYVQHIDSALYDIDFVLECDEAIDAGAKDWFFSDWSDSKIARLKDNNKNHENFYLVDNRILQEFDDTLQYWSVLIVIACCILILPYLVKNRLSRVVTLQYASKKGRGILKNQLLATLTAGFIVFMVLFAVFQMFYFSLGVAPLLNSRIDNTLSLVTWYDFTFIQYMAVSWLRSFVFVMAVCLVMFWISQYSKNYIVAIVCALPVAVLFSAALNEMPILLYVENSFKGMTLVICLGLLAVVSAISLAVYKKHRSAELLFE